MFDHQKKELKPEDVTGEPLVVKYLLIQVFGYFMPLGLTTWMAFVGSSPMIPSTVKDGNASPLFFLVLL